MICPRCNESIKYKERSNLTCSKCNKDFAFEPKGHPLALNDLFFKKVVNKLSDNDKLYFTAEQLQFALSRKKLKSDLNALWLLIPAIITTIIATFIFVPAAIVVAIGWIILIVYAANQTKTNFALPQTLVEFERSVLNGWKRVYQTLPTKLITENVVNPTIENLRGLLFCNTQDIANCLIANKINKHLGLAILTQATSEILQKRTDLPIFVLHDASFDGCNFTQQIKDQFGSQRKVFDIGLRPQSVMKAKLAMFRENVANVNKDKSLTIEEKKWLAQGYYTPLFVMKPAQLLKFVTNRIEKRLKNVAVDNSENQAKTIGFMTWVGEK